MTGRPFHSERVHRVPHVIHATRPQMGLELVVICDGVHASSPFSRPLERSVTGALTPRRVATAWVPPACWYSTTATTAQNSRQSRLFLTTTTWKELRNVFPNRKLK